MRPIAGLLLLAAGSALAAPPAAPDPWARVPKLTTACYSGSDPFGPAVDQAFESMQQENYKQQEINAAIEEQFNSIDPMEKASRMQSFLMQNPQDAAKYMQAVQSDGAAFNEALPKDSEAQQQLDAELEAILEKYNAALDKATGPIFAKLRALPDGEAATAESVAESKRLIAQLNAEYEKLCPAWWGAAGPIHAWFPRYRSHLQQAHLPYLMILDDQKMAQCKIFGIPADNFRSTYPNETVMSYLDRMRKVFGHRWPEARQ